MSISINGIAHLQMNVSPGGKALEFWERLCHFLEMETLLQGQIDILLAAGPVF